MENNAKWQYRFLVLASHVATWSKDPSTKVGAVITDTKNRIVSLGFNGFPRGVSDAELPREEKLLRTIHAEENAILFAQRDLTYFTIYVTHPPFAKCAAKIIQAGLRRVVCWLPSPEFRDRWAAELQQAHELCSEVGIEFILIERGGHYE